MTRGLKVAGGERLGKTIVFAKNNEHAEFIATRFNVHYPHLKGEFARVITFKVEYAQSLIDAFSDASKAPHIAISVVMLDTGIDVPEVLNLVVEHLTELGVMDPSRLYESPFTDVSPAGPDALFSQAQVDRIVEVLRDVKTKAA